MESNFISQVDLSTLYSQEIKSKGKNGIKETLNKKKPLEEQEIRNSIFLCHSHLDKTIVEKVSILFERMHVGMYIDWMDLTMPRETNHITAKTIKSRIEQCKKFIFLATYNALKSKWCNWELGLAYASRIDNDFAILPIETKSGKWLGNEYLNLYPVIKIEGRIEDIVVNHVKVFSTNGKEMEFLDWLTQ